MYIKFGIIFLVFAAWFSWVHHYYICDVRNLCRPNIPTTDSIKFYNIAHTLHVKAQDYAIIENYPEFYFDHNSAQPIELKAHKDFYKILGTFLQDNPSAKLRITGRYLEKEQTLSQEKDRYNDLGMARAMVVLDKLHNEFGIANERLIPKSQAMVQDTLVAPIAFDILDYTPPAKAGINTEVTTIDTFQYITDEPIPVEDLKEQIKTSITDVVYFDKNESFEFGSQKFKPSEDFDVYVEALKTYLQENPTAALLVIGHTDTKGSAKYNQELGLKRANAVKAYLATKGIKQNIKTESKGENEPIVIDQNAKGVYMEDAMAKNRRVNIKILEN